MFQTKVVEKIKTHILYHTALFFENRALHETMWKILQIRQSPMKIWRMRTACWILRTTNTHSEYVIPTDFLRQQWLGKRASMSFYTYISRLVNLGTGRRWVLASGHGRFIPGEKALGTHWSGCRVSSMNCTDDLKKTNPSLHKITKGRI